MRGALLRCCLHAEQQGDASQLKILGNLLLLLLLAAAAAALAASAAFFCCCSRAPGTPLVRSRLQRKYLAVAAAAVAAAAVAAASG